MIELGQKYSSKELAEEVGVTYATFRHNRERYEQHLLLFYDFEVSFCGPSKYYVFTEQLMDYIPYKEYKKQQKNDLFKRKIKSVIAHDPRQTGANIGRIIFVDGEVEALNYTIGTVTNYTRANLKELVKQGYYILTDYRWCILDNNRYIELNDDQVKELREFFQKYDTETKEEQENIMAQRQDGTISKSEANEKIGDMKFNGFVKGIQDYTDKYGHRPIKVPVYERCAFIEKQV